MRSDHKFLKSKRGHQKLPLSEQSSSAPHFGHRRWQADNSPIIVPHLIHSTLCF